MFLSGLGSRASANPKPHFYNFKLSKPSAVLNLRLGCDRRAAAGHCLKYDTNHNWYHFVAMQISMMYADCIALNKCGPSWHMIDMSLFKSYNWLIYVEYMTVKRCLRLAYCRHIR